jgi:mRNA interferase HicA
MKRKEFLKYLRSQECKLLREGSRHTEISNALAKKICKDLGVPPIKP